MVVVQAAQEDAIANLKEGGCTRCARRRHQESQGRWLYTLRQNTQSRIARKVAVHVAPEDAIENLKEGGCTRCARRRRRKYQGRWLYMLRQKTQS